MIVINLSGCSDIYKVFRMGEYIYSVLYTSPLQRVTIGFNRAVFVNQLKDVFHCIAITLVFVLIIIINIQIA